jgi:predicted transcriptional regulator
MNNEFFTDSSTGYNLKTINYGVYQELIMNNKIINKSDINEIGYSINYSDNTIYNYQSSNTMTTGVTPPIMWCTFFNTIDTGGIKNYIQSPFNDDFYLHTVKIKFPELSSEELSKKRDEMKMNMMYFLFDNKTQHRKNNMIIQLLSSVYPSVEEWINNIHSTIGKEKFAYILQRSESYLILNEICREFYSLNPSIPLFTIHDAILTYDEYIPELTSLILRRCKEITGIEVGCKISAPEINCNPTSDEIKHIWNKIKNINTEKKFKQLEGVFENNILKGHNFLEIQ